ncbi:ATP-binding cassette sub-family B member 7, mitochondrial [Thelohanellus kitauei]|uniref:Iron-sulfur clusters transporter ABCB7, mitochondrial n=1 Tax=Thelohanellus kitauei TaxID=669202 RepID=A0A0C2MYU6_THEKT|nr:ATP-binding cassette sub-family B member 7, mitochondrial [Thelohanellus kitauei]
MDPSRGSIKFMDQDYKKFSLESLRKQIAVIPQDQVLFHNTIMYNIRYGNINATDEQVYTVSKLCGLHESIMKFPNKYLTQVGERGLKLSGGEKQRIALARAVLKDSPIVLFDEATSSLDSITEKKIINTLSARFKNRTSVVIAHRLSTIVNADEILVFQDGKIVEQGTHVDLLVNNPLGPYALMWNKQQELVEPPRSEHVDLDYDDQFDAFGCPKAGCCSK